jgi:hypothetical protein
MGATRVGTSSGAFGTTTLISKEKSPSSPEVRARCHRPRFRRTRRRRCLQLRGFGRQGERRRRRPQDQRCARRGLQAGSSGRGPEPRAVETDMNPASGAFAEAEQALIALGRHGRPGERMIDQAVRQLLFAQKRDELEQVTAAIARSASVPWSRSGFLAVTGLGVFTSAYVGTRISCIFSRISTNWAAPGRLAPRRPHFPRRERLVSGR